MESTETAPLLESAMVNRIPAPQIRAEMDRILRSRVFIHSHRIRRFLQFIVEECLTEQQQRLKEYLIGLEVFNRLETFDPRVDSIVRVEARRLRRKLEEYYETEGQHDEIRIELRKGSYVPIIERCNPANGNGYRTLSTPVRRRSLAISHVDGAGEPSQPIDAALERLSHALVKQGFFQVILHRDGAHAGSQTNGHTNGEHSGVNGHSLGVHSTSQAEYVLEATHDHSDGDGLIRLRLLSVAEQSYVWSDSGHLASLESMANALNRAVITASGNAESTGRTKLHATDRTSFDHYLQGRYCWKLGTPDAVHGSAAFFSQAVARDPGYAAAWAALAQASIVNCIFGHTDPGEAKLEDIAPKAVALDARLPEAHLALGCLQSLVDYDWEAGERSFQKAIQLDGRDSTAHLAYGLQLACRGLTGAALSEVERALESEPASLAANFVLGWLYGVDRRYDDAIAQHRLISRLAPDYPLAYLGLGWGHSGKGLFSDALAHFTNASSLMRAKTLLAGRIGYCYARLNKRDEALLQLAIVQAEGRNAAGRVSEAAIYAGLEQNDRALAELELAAEGRDCGLPLQLLNPEFDSLRGDVRFQALRQGMGLEPAREAAGAGS